MAVEPRDQDRPRALVFLPTRWRGTSAERDLRGASSPGVRSIPSCASRSPTSPASRGFPDPRRPDLAAPLRAPRPLPRRRRLRPVAAGRALRPLVVARPGPALRRDADQQAAARLAGGEPAPTRSSSTPTAAGTSRPAGRRRSCAPTRPSWPPAGRRAWRRGAPGAGRAGSRPSAAAREALDGRAGRPRRRSTEPGLHRALGSAHRDGDLVYTASSMPIRDQEAFLAAGDDRRPLPLQPRRQRHRRPRSPPGSAPPTPAAGRPRSSPATSASSTTSAASPPCATSRPRSASSSSTTTAAASSTSCPRPRRSADERVRGPARHPPRRRRRQGRRPLRPPPPPTRLARRAARRARRRHRPDRNQNRPSSQRHLASADL